MLDRAPYIEKAEAEADGPVLVSSKARLKVGTDMFGKEGLLCATERALVFVEDKILSPGEVTVTPVAEVSAAQGAEDLLSAVITIERGGDQLTFTDVVKAQAGPLLAAAGLDEGPSVSAEAASEAPPAPPAFDVGVTSSEASPEPEALELTFAPADETHQVTFEQDEGAVAGNPRIGLRPRG